MSDKPPDDPTRWYPLGQYVEDDDNYMGKRDDDTQTFTLARSDMAALNRFTQTGRKLPLSRSSYQTQMGLTSESELTTDVWNAVDKMLVSFKTINGDCNNFLLDDGDNKGTWAKAVDAMLEAVNAYNEADNEDDKNEQKELVREYANMQMKDCTDLATAAETVETELGDFQTRCSSYATDLSGHEKTLQNLLDQEYGDIEDIKADIEKQTALIKSKQSNINAGEKSPFVGAIAAAIVTAVMEGDIADLTDAIMKLQDIITSDQEKIRIVGSVQGHVTNMKTEVHDLNEILNPAIQTLGKLKGAWQTMGTMLQALNDAFNKPNDEIDYPSIVKTELDKIRRKWNDLGVYTKQHQEVAYLTDEPKETSLQDYVDELNSNSMKN
ncbi:uncharacterized protein KD926_006692 [Aspergillus affinis]|uniref:uncharacterized protein n=1 Tax=Aspergillus affinis TaxID=1070780 RepID=UPI0022FE3842|nr:uncharacterized protein KD926_006692 [Aspergillus affinis]KAI9041618.1 hypothetical protein KD926_006692 [Aspergillus affinis]